MNLKNIKPAIEVFFSDPVRRHYFFWAAVYVLITVVGLGTAVMNGMRAGRLAETAKGLRAQVQSRGLASPQAMAGGAVLKSKQFIDESEIPTMLSSISREAGTASLNLKKINTQPVMQIDGGKAYNRVPIVIQVEGNYFKLGDFMRSLSEKLPWIFSWQSVKLSSPQMDGILQADLQIDFYSKRP